MLWRNDELLFNGPKVFLALSSMGFLLYFSNVWLACTYTLSCNSFVPTLSYLGAFRNHDRVFVLACTFYSVVLQLINLGVQCHFSDIFPSVTRLLSTIVGFGASVCLICLSLFDEVNGIIAMETYESLHSILTILLWVSGLVWGLLVYRSFAETELAPSKQYWLDVLKKLLVLELILGILTMLEWHFAYTPYNNFLVNESVEAVCEWILVAGGVFAPFVIANLLPGFIFTLKLSSSKSFELSEVLVSEAQCV